MKKFKNFISTIIIFNRSLSPNTFVGVMSSVGRLEVVYLISTIGTCNMYEVFKSPQNCKVTVGTVL